MYFCCILIIPECHELMVSLEASGTDSDLPFDDDE